MAGWCIRWHVNYSAFKRGLSCVEVSGGLMAVRWSERRPVGRRRGDGGPHVDIYPQITHTGSRSHR